MRSRQVIPTLAVAMTFWAAPLFAQDAPATTAPAEGSPEEDAAELDRAARSLFEAGKIAFDLGRYEEALEYLQQAHDLSQRPILLFNIASTLDRLRRDAEALETFERYIREVPDAANRPAVEGRIRLLREVVERAKQEEAAREAADARQREAQAQASANATGQAAAPAVQSVTLSAEPSDGGGLSPVWVIVGGGVTVVSGVVATLFGLNTLSARDQYEKYAAEQEPSDEARANAKSLYDDGVARQTRTNVLIGLTAALGVGTAVLALLTDWNGQDESPATSATGFVSIDGGGVLVNGKF